uniref:Nuclear pore complex protein n=1 Tax=Haptolina ericina TaxID=156174 RepID=A0A7S3EXA7_9EUKA|mmetsp:Transcript_29109/g.65925  ORF Transcript_29109/g.65925 Transcript_29109/m.65925 type:complete len:100 (+) Transcript_29109:3-302(+)
MREKMRETMLQPGQDAALPRGGLEGIRSRMVVEMVQTLQTVLLRTGAEANDPVCVHKSFEIADLMAEERYGLVEYFTQKQIHEMLFCFRESALQILKCG